MYSSPHQVNQLVSLIQEHDIQDFVVCPGSRNATIVHDLYMAQPRLKLHPVTDERSAAFVALGIILATHAPVAVCVTSGSALLGCIPATAEAYYRHLPLLVISADRPSEWIGQGDGQTLPQNQALEPYAPTFNLRIPKDEADNWANNRLINEALLRLQHHNGSPVHLNVPIAEPMFDFDTQDLPGERAIFRFEPRVERPVCPDICDLIAQARLPMLVVGHYERGDLRTEVEQLNEAGQLLVMPEIIADVAGSLRMPVFDAIRWDEEQQKAYLDDEEVTAYLPDVVIHIGGNFVHKRFKQLLRQTNCRVIRIGLEDGMPDTFCHLTHQIICTEQAALAQLAQVLPHRHAGVVSARDFYDAKAEAAMQSLAALTQLTLSAPKESKDRRPTMEETLALLRHSLKQMPQSYSLHLGNSSAVRVAARIFPSGEQPIFCNRGTNGIEGSVSTTVGYSLAMWGLHVLVIGDLSFFYDANALWNTELTDNVRILVLNNHHGAIFDRLPGLEKSPARNTFIAAGRQDFSARGICEAYHLDYLSAGSLNELTARLPEWLGPHGRSCLLEVEL